MITRNDINNFDFEYWSKLAQDDPTAFELERKKLLNNFIKTAPEKFRHKLHSLQTLVDWERSQCATPQESLERITQMMLNKLRGELLPALEKVGAASTALTQKIRNLKILNSINKSDGNIIPFPNQMREKIT